MTSTKEKTNRAIKYILMALITAILVRYIPAIMVSDKIL